VQDDSHTQLLALHEQVDGVIDAPEGPTDR
jgi:hypothetical protein